MIDDILPFEKKGARFEKAPLFLRFSEESRKRRLFLAKEFSRLGANVMLIKIALCSKEAFPAFRYSEEDGISVLSVPVSIKEKPKSFPFRELFAFNAALSEAFAALSGLFAPDVVISAGFLPISVFAGAKIAEAAGAVLVTELSCSPAELLLKNGLCLPFEPVLTVLKRAENAAFSKSEAVLGFFPAAAERFGASKLLYPMRYPAPETEKTSSASALALRESLGAFGEGKTFVLACALPLEKGFSIPELMTVCGNFGDKFALVFLSGGTNREAYKRLASEKGLTNVFFMEPVPEEKIPFVLSAADGIFLSENEGIKGLCSEHECFFTSLLAGRPVIASAEYNADFFRKSGGAVIIKPKSKEGMRLGIKALMEMSEGDRNTLGLLNRKFAEENSPEKFARDYFSVLEKSVDQKERLR